VVWRWSIFIRGEAGEGTSTHAILMAVGAVIAVAVLGVVGKALVGYFAHFSQCLNGC
jgi:Flp pilus assembly pilin Flp